MWSCIILCVFVTKPSLQTRQMHTGFLWLKDLVVCDPLLQISHVICKPHLQDTQLQDKKPCIVNRQQLRKIRQDMTQKVCSVHFPGISSNVFWKSYLLPRCKGHCCTIPENSKNFSLLECMCAARGV